jgi:hypothetical protein
MPILLLLLALALGAVAQPVPYNHPELEWRTIQLEHVDVHYHQGEEQLALVVCEIMEDIWGPVTELYDYVPDTKVHIVFHDTDDYSNGGAYYYNNKIMIWATSLDFDLRGEHNWLRNVLTHEFTHIIQLGASRKFSRRMPAAYVQVMDYEEEKREDVLYGFPNVVASYPFPGTLVPLWFAEGTAQSMVEGLDYDWWDSSRDMVLRDRVIHNSLYSFHEMEAFDKNTVGGESVYNMGFSFVRWLRQRFGQDALRRVSEAMARPMRVSMDAAMEEALGTPGRVLYDEWTRGLVAHYDSLLVSVREHRREGRRISDSDQVEQGSGGGAEGRWELIGAPTGHHHDAGPVLPSCCGFMHPDVESPADRLGATNNVYARVGRDGRFVYYLSNGDAEYLGITALWRYDRQTGERSKLLDGVRGSFTLDPEGRFAVVCKRSQPDAEGSHFNDLFIYWFEEELARPLTEHKRLSQPDLAPDGRTLVAVQNGGGSTRLVTLSLDSSYTNGAAYKELSKGRRKKLPTLEPVVLGELPYGTQVYQPRFAPDGHTVWLARSRYGNRDLWTVDLADGRWQQRLATEFDERYPSPSPDGQWLYYSQDRTGIFNIYRMHLADGRRELLTNTPGCAFMPAVSGDTLYFSCYEDRGFRLHELAGLAALSEEQARYFSDYAALIPEVEINDDQPAARESMPQPLIFEKSFVVPRLMVDGGELKPGFFLLSTDLMERIQLTAGITAARLNNLDLFAGIERSWRRNWLFVQLYMLNRDESRRFDDPSVIIGVDDDGGPIFDQSAVDYRFNLLELDTGIRRRLNDATTVELAAVLSRYNTHLDLGQASVFSYDYFVGRSLRAGLDFNIDLGRTVDQFINPRNSAWLRLDGAYNGHKFIRDFEITPSGQLDEVYDLYHFVELGADFGRLWTFPWTRRIAWGVEGEAGWLSRNDVDDFFYTYAGGLAGMRGYSYYSMGGTRRAAARAILGFPIVERVGVRLGHLYFKRLYGRLFAGAGDAWTGSLDQLDLKREAGLELRLSLDSWNAFPTALTLTSAYGLDEFPVPQLDPGDEPRLYGKEWRWYATVLFGFDAF